jgi:hypothetical protein
MLVGLIWYRNDVSIVIAMVSSIVMRQLAIVDSMGEATAIAELAMKIFSLTMMSEIQQKSGRFLTS